MFHHDALDFILAVLDKTLPFDCFMLLFLLKPMFILQVYG